MRLPLYDPVSSETNACFQNGHAGLWFDKFCNTWKNNNDCPTMSAEEKLCWIKTVTKTQVGGQELIKEHSRRQARMVERLGGRFEVFSTESRFVTGLGRSHPVENGFAWHPTLGTPFLPGSSVKGLIRAWAKHNAEPRTDSEMLGRVFGKPGRVGCVCFLDAVPTGTVRLKADIMTPHYAGWTPECPPADWRSPNPIPFLVTAKNTPFLFGFTPCGHLESDDFDRIFGWLRDALTWAGGGAKTAVGYGRFRHEDKLSRSMMCDLEKEKRILHEKHEREQLEKTPEGRWNLKIRDRSEDAVLDLVRIHLEKAPLTDARERRAFASAISALRADWLECWRRGDCHEPNTSVGRKKRKERAQLIDRVLTEAGSGQNGETSSW